MEQMIIDRPGELWGGTSTKCPTQALVCAGWPLDRYDAELEAGSGYPRVGFEAGRPLLRRAGQGRPVGFLPYSNVNTSLPIFQNFLNTHGRDPGIYDNPI